MTTAEIARRLWDQSSFSFQNIISSLTPAQSHSGGGNAFAPNALTAFADAAATTLAAFANSRSTTGSMSSIELF